MTTPEISVVKIGGSVLNSDDTAGKLIGCLKPRLKPGSTVLIHGGGGDINMWLGRLGIKPRFLEGQRVTDPDTMKVVEMVLSGLMNKRLVNLLGSEGINAAGLSGRDGNLAIAGIIDEKLGSVGAVREVNPRILFGIMGSGMMPVVSPVSSGPEGEPVNVNADFFAAEIASALGASELNLVTASGGVIENGRIVGEISCGGIPELISGGVATDGMIPKLQAAAAARKGGVRRVNILNYEGQTGTCVL